MLLLIVLIQMYFDLTVISYPFLDLYIYLFLGPASLFEDESGEVSSFGVGHVGGQVVHSPLIQQSAEEGRRRATLIQHSPENDARPSGLRYSMRYTEK